MRGQGRWQVRRSWPTLSRDCRRRPVSAGRNGGWEPAVQVVHSSFGTNETCTSPWRSWRDFYNTTQDSSGCEKSWAHLLNQTTTLNNPIRVGGGPGGGFIVEMISVDHINFRVKVELMWVQDPRFSVQDWSFKCPSNVIWPFKICLFQNNPSKRNPELKMKTSLEVLNILCSLCPS